VWRVSSRSGEAGRKLHCSVVVGYSAEHQVDEVTASDAGLYAVDVDVTGVLPQSAWNNVSMAFSCHLVVLGLSSPAHL